MDAKQLNERCEMIGTAARLMAIKACSETRISLPQVLEKCLRLAHSLAEQILMQEHHAATEAAQREQDERWRAEDEKLYGNRKVGDYSPETAELFVAPKAGEAELSAAQQAFQSLPSNQGAID